MPMLISRSFTSKLLILAIPRRLLHIGKDMEVSLTMCRPSKGATAGHFTRFRKLKVRPSQILVFCHGKTHLQDRPTLLLAPTLHLFPVQLLRQVCILYLSIIPMSINIQWTFIQMAPEVFVEDWHQSGTVPSSSSCRISRPVTPKPSKQPHL